MPDYDRLLSQQRNILLEPEISTRDAIRAGVQATTGRPYAEGRSAILAERYNRALGAHQVVSSERNFQAQQEQRLWTRAQAEAERGDENFKMLIELSSAYGASPADSQRLAASVIQRTEAEDVDDPSGLPALVAGEAEKLGLPARSGAAPKIVPAGAAYGTVDPVTGDFNMAGQVPTKEDAGISLYDPQTGNIIAQVGGTPLTKSQTGAQGIEIADEIRATGERLSELSNALNSLERTPEATGIRGIVTERLGGVAEQLGDMVGVDGDWLGTADVQTTRTTLASLLGRYIPTVTGDESGRYSDRDMQRAEAALPATRATASYNQVRSALLTLGDIERRARGRALMRLDGLGPEIDITYPEGRESYAVTLFREGKTPEEAARIIQEMMDKYEIAPGLEGIR